jgi:hypothetical protein
LAGKGNLAADLHKVVSAGSQRSTADRFDTAEQAIAAFTHAEQAAVIVVDDSDTWLRTELGDRRDLVDKFFGGVFSKVTRDLSVGLLVASRGIPVGSSRHP